MVSDAELNKALKAFRKRLKLAKLDEESKLSSARAMTSGRTSGIVAIMPPHGFAREIWQELVNRGKLKPAGHGMYEIV
jgi:hypothetical protein